MNAGPYVYLWEYHVRPEALAMFLAHYDTDGAWSRLFRRARGYLGTELYRDTRDDERYLTIDRWENEAAFQSFKLRFAAEYESLDHACGEFTHRERRLGEFTAVHHERTG